MCIQICVSDGYLEIVRGMCVSLCLGLRVCGWELIEFALYVYGGWVGLNEFVWLLVTMYKCLGAVMNKVMRIVWALVYVGWEGVS